MARYECSVCGFVYDEEMDGSPWGELNERWACPICGADRGYFNPQGGMAADPPPAGGACESHTEGLEGYLSQWRRTGDAIEEHLDAVQHAALTGTPLVEPMRTRKPLPSWDQILFKGAQLARLPLNADEAVDTTTTLGPGAEKPLVINTPVFISHMSFGALSREAKTALARGSAAVRTAMCSGEGGLLPESCEASHKYIFEYVPRKYSVCQETWAKVDAVEIKIGQAAKPGLGGLLPGSKVTEEIARVRGVPVGESVESPARFDDIATPDDLRDKVDWLREQTRGLPIGIKLAAGHIEEDLEIALHAQPDFITIDGRGGATGAAPKAVKDAAAVPTLHALVRARRFLDQRGRADVSLVITGGLRISSDFAKAIALGADAVAIATAALMAIGCQQYRICNTGNCPVGVATQDPELRKRFEVGRSAERLENYLRATTHELREFARLTGRRSIHDLDRSDLVTTDADLAKRLDIQKA